MSFTWQPPRGLDAPHAPASRVIAADRAFLATGADVIADPAVVISDGTIRWVGPRAELPAEYANLPIEAHPGATILPGLIETHAHLASYETVFPLTTPDPQLHARSLAAISSVTIARQLASIGVTTVQSLGSRYFADVALREAINSGVVAGPNVVAAGPQLTTSAGHSWTNGAEVDSIDDIRKQVREHHKAGVDVIKVMATGGFMSTNTSPWKPQFTEEELRALVGEATRLGKHTAAHAHSTEGIRRAVDAGISYIAHGSFIDDDGRTSFDPWLADRIAEAGVFVDVCSPPSWPPVPGETMAPRARQLYEHGVQLVTGHDIGAVIPASAYHYGLQQLELAGIPRYEVLLSATTRAAAATGLAGVTGALLPEYRADLIIARGNPLEDLHALEDLEEVIIDGSTFARDAVHPYRPEEETDEDGEDSKERASATFELRARRYAVAERRLHHPLPALTPVSSLQSSAPPDPELPTSPTTDS
ncbi:MAG: amidohydrolase family protein [Ancrocorticia sp.]